MAYFIKHQNEAINLDLVEKITLNSNFHANEYSMVFKLPSEDKTWHMGETAFNELDKLIRKTTQDAE